MWMYPVVFLAALGVDLIPVFAPPAWTLMVFFLVKFDLNPWIVLFAGVTGSALGRYIFSLYIPKVSGKLIKRRKDQELEFVGKKLGQSRWKTWTFVFVYTLTPLSTTALFTAAGMAKIHPVQTVPPFFIGKLLSDGVLIVMGKHLSSNAGDFLHDLCSAKGILTMVFGLVVIGGLLFIDWRTLLQRRKLKFNFKIWK
jgi:membrane protein DedA with SNARE-associated domain